MGWGTKPSARVQVTHGTWQGFELCTFLWPATLTSPSFTGRVLALHFCGMAFQADNERIAPGDYFRPTCLLPPYRFRHCTLLCRMQTFRPGRIRSLQSRRRRDEAEFGGELLRERCILPPAKKKPTPPSYRGETYYSKIFTASGISRSEGANCTFFSFVNQSLREKILLWFAAGHSRVATSSHHSIHYFYH